MHTAATYSFTDVTWLTYITPAVHISKLVQMCFDGSQVLLLYVAEQTLDGQRGHLQGGGGIHG